MSLAHARSRPTRRHGHPAATRHQYRRSGSRRVRRHLRSAPPVTGVELSHHDELHRHRLDRVGPTCEACRKPFRTAASASSYATPRDRPRLRRCPRLFRLWRGFNIGRRSARCLGELSKASRDERVGQFIEGRLWVFERGCLLPKHPRTAVGSALRFSEKGIGLDRYEPERLQRGLREILRVRRHDHRRPAFHRRRDDMPVVGVWKRDLIDARLVAVTSASTTAAFMRCRVRASRSASRSGRFLRWPSESACPEGAPGTERSRRAGDWARPVQ